MSEKIRIAIVVSHPIQHFVHLYRALAAHPGVELKVIYSCDIGARRYFDKDMNVEIAWKTDLFSGYEYTILPESPNIEGFGFRSINNPSISRVLSSYEPDVVQIHGYAQLTMLRALTWCRVNRVPALLWSDSSLLFQRSLMKRMIKRVAVNMIMRNFSAVLATGDNNVSYYRHYGVPERKMFRCPFTVDEKLLYQARSERDSTRKSMREKYNIPDSAFLLLFTAKLIPRKRAKDVLDSLILLRQQRSPAAESIFCFFAGDGYLKSELEEFASKNRLPVIFGGFINVDQLPSVYAMADAFVFPSDREPYGLVAREAICVGLPLIVSDQIGCTGGSDAARPNENAMVYPAGDIVALSSAIASICDTQMRQRMSDASLRIAEEMNVQTSVNGFVDAAITVTRKQEIHNP